MGHLSPLIEDDVAVPTCGPPAGMGCWGRAPTQHHPTLRRNFGSVVIALRQSGHAKLRNPSWEIMPSSHTGEVCKRVKRHVLFEW